MDYSSKNSDQKLSLYKFQFFVGIVFIWELYLLQIDLIALTCTMSGEGRRSFAKKVRVSSSCQQEQREGDLSFCNLVGSVLLGYQTDLVCKVVLCYSQCLGWIRRNISL